jgi:hypothetical protein
MGLREAEADPGLLGPAGKPVARRHLSPAEAEGFIDKVQIAEESMQRLQTYREAGNPHIREGLLLASIQEDPDLVKVDPLTLHEELVRITERKEGAGPWSSPGSLRPAAAPSTPRTEKIKPSPAGWWDALLAVGGGTAVCLGALYLALRRRGDEIAHNGAAGMPTQAQSKKGA